MKLEEFLSLIQDEDVRIELAIEEPSKDDYVYHQFWLSDFRSDLGITKHYREYQVKSFGFFTGADIQIVIKS